MKTMNSEHTHDLMMFISDRKDTYPASYQQLSYLYSLADSNGLDAEALSTMAFGKDLADITKSEAELLIEQIKN